MKNRSATLVKLILHQNKKRRLDTKQPQWSTEGMFQWSFYPECEKQFMQSVQQLQSVHWDASIVLEQLLKRFVIGETVHTELDKKHPIR